MLYGKLVKQNDPKLLNVKIEMFVGVIISALSLGLFFTSMFFLIFDGKIDNIILNTGDIVNKLNPVYLFYNFIFEKSGFEIQHHIKNFIINAFFATSSFYYVNVIITLYPKIRTINHFTINLYSLYCSSFILSLAYSNGCS